MAIKDFIDTVTSKEFWNEKKEQAKDFATNVQKPEFWTGHDLALDIGTAKQVVEDTRSVSTGVVATAKNNIETAVEELNKVSVNAGTVSVENINSLFTEIGSAIEGLAGKLQEKIELTEAYSKASLPKQLLSTHIMLNVKALEGVLSVVEELGDAVVGVVGWTIDNEDFKRGCENFIKWNPSHDVFNFYYKSDLAKASSFTEDSGVAGASRIVGKVGAYLYAGGLLAKLGIGISGAVGTATNALATSGVPVISNVAGMGLKAGGAIANVVSASTWGATAAAGLSGLGSGTEAGLHAGKTLDKGGGALQQGVIQGGIQAAVAFGTGYARESAARADAVKQTSQAFERSKTSLENASNAYETADEAFTNAETSLENASNAYETADGVFTNAEKSLENASNAYETADEALTNAEKSLESASNAYEQALEKVEAEKARIGTYYKKSSIYRAAEAQADDAANALNSASANYQTAEEAVKTTGNALNAASESYLAAEEAVNTTGTALNAASTNYQAAEGALKVAGNALNAASESYLAAEQAVTDAAVATYSGYSDAFSKKGRGETNNAGLVTTGNNVTKAAEVAAIPAKFVVETVKNPTITANAIVNNAAESGSSIYPGATAMEGIQIPSASNGIKVTDNTTGRTNISDPIAPPTDTPPTNTPPTDTPPTNTPPTDTPPTGTTQNNTSNSYSNDNSSSNPNYTNQQPITDNTTNQNNSNNQIDPINPVNPSYIDTTDNTSSNPTNTTPSDSVASESVTPPSQNPIIEYTNETPIYHTGGGYSETDGYTPIDDTLQNESLKENTLEGLVEETTTSIDQIIKGNKYTKIPTSTTPIKKTPSTTGGSNIIPIAAGLSAAAAAGIGAKAYIDRKNNSDNGDEDDFEDDWSENESENLDYADDTTEVVDTPENEEETYLTEEDAYEGEKYDARNNEELEDLQ